MTTKKRKKSATLRALEATTKALRQIAQQHVGPVANVDGARFVQCFVQARGPYGVIHALDGNGQVWELHTVLDSSTKQVTEQFWTPVGMTRKP